jgi:putative flippase GtrA
MSLVNYLLVGVLGAIVGIALYAARWDMSRHGGYHDAPAIELHM